MRVTATAIAFCVASASSVFAEDPPESASQLSARGVELGKQGKYAEAAAAFKKAFALEPKATYLCNIGMTYYGQNDFARTHLYLTRCFQMAGAPVAGIVKPLEYATSQLESSQLAKVLIESNPAGAEVAVSAMAGELRFPTPLAVWLPAGEHTVALTLDGHEPASQKIAVTAKVAQSVLVAMKAIEKPEPEPPPVEEPLPEVVPEPEPIVEIAPPPGPADSRWKRKTAWGFAAGSTLALGAALVTRIRAGQIHRDTLADCMGCPPEPGPIYNERRDRVERWYYSSIALLAISGALAATSAVMFAWPVAVAPAPGGAVVQLSISR